MGASRAHRQTGKETDKRNRHEVLQGGAGTFGLDTITFGGWVSDGNFKVKQKVPGYFWTTFNCG